MRLNREPFQLLQCGTCGKIIGVIKKDHSLLTTDQDCDFHIEQISYWKAVSAPPRAQTYLADKRFAQILEKYGMVFCCEEHARITISEKFISPLIYPEEFVDVSYKELTDAFRENKIKRPECRTCKYKKYTETKNNRVYSYCSKHESDLTHITETICDMYRYDETK